MSSSHPLDEAGRIKLRFACLLSLVILTALSAGCAVHRTLRLTEIGKNMFEIYLDEPAANSLTLQDHRLIVTTDNTHIEVDLSVFGRSLKGGEFMMVWEAGNYNDNVPVAQDYPSGVAGTVPGIKVLQNTFLDLGNKNAAEVRLSGRHSRGVVTDLTDDCVRYGDLATRPRTGGTFFEDGVLPMPRSGAPLMRKWDTVTGRPLDTDQESDWVVGGGTWGVKSN